MIAAETQVATFLASFVRVGAWTFTAPVLGQGMVPPRIRAFLAGAIALLVFSLRPPLDYAGLATVLPYEIGLGVLIGAAARFCLAGVEAGGQLIGIQMGIGFAGITDPLSQEQSLPTRRLVLALAVLAFIAAGGFDEAIRALAMPVDASTLTLAPLETMIATSEHVLVSAIRLAAPLLLAGFVANVTMALISKAAPAMNVFSVMLGLFVLVGLLVLFATAPATVRDVEAAAREATHVVWRLLR